MMNMYRESDEPKYKKKGIISKIKKAIETSAIKRVMTLNSISKKIETVDEKDTKSLKNIVDVIKKLDLCDNQFGDQLYLEDIELLIEKIKKNGNLESELEFLKANLANYKTTTSNQPEM